VIDTNDVQWWLLEAQQHPDTIPELIRLLAERIALLSRQNEELRGDLITARRKGNGAASAEVQALQDRIMALEQISTNGGRPPGPRLLIYRPGQLIVSQPVDSIDESGVGAVEPGVNMLIADESARLLAITDESRAFNVTLHDLPIPDKSPIPIDTPRGIIAFLDLATLERRRYLTLLSQRGYVYSILVGAVARMAAKQEPLIRNLIPDDPIVAAVASGGSDLLACSRLGRWARFPERTIAGAGSQVFTLAKGDALAGITALEAHMLVMVFTAEGEMFVRAAESITVGTAPGKATGTVSKGVVVLGVAAGLPSQTLTILTRHGDVITLPIDRLPYRARSEDSIPIPTLHPGDAVAAFMIR